MSQTAIPLQFEKYLKNQISVGKAPDMNEMIFAYIPNLDPSQPIDRNQGLPAVSTWVHQQNIDQVGKLGDNALVYSVVIPGSVAAFTFNAIYLRDKNVPNSCGMVVHKATETKEAGMASTKSLMQQYTGAAQIAGITVDAQTWQIDYQARLFGIEEDMRLANLDTYGHTAFIQGFDVTQQADPAKYKVAAGVVYIGGLRAELKNEVIQTISAKPTGLYIDVVRTGTVLSKWQNIVTVRASTTPLTDYVDQNQQQHNVARLAGINADGSVEDWREKGGLPEHEAAENPHPQYPLASSAQFLAYNPVRIYSAGEVCYTKDPESGELSYWQWYSNVESLAGKTPLDTANRHIGWQDNTKPFYWIPYTGDQVGMPFFWLAADAPEWAVMEINVDLPIAVYWRLARRYPDLVNGSVINTGEIRDEFLRVWDNGRGRTQNRELNSTQAPTQIPFVSMHNTGSYRHLVTPPINSWSDTLFPSNSEERLSAPSGTYYQGVVSNTSSGASGLISYATYPRNTARAMAIAI
ncbi:phage tail protein [Vibrio metoecus]|uniref:phage tail-collar fiber domain-containing protein n=1 Tax=Vibrio metoecus TaxID=1481663 RepID=UPI001EE9D7D9|nr:phage tail protein [Vibrio metoecus]